MNDPSGETPLTFDFWQTWWPVTIDDEAPPSWQVAVGGLEDQKLIRYAKAAGQAI